MSFALPSIARLDPLPRYARDPETSSILSSAPSYTSAAPSYHSNQATRRPSVLTHAQTYAPGFTAARQQTANPRHQDALHQFNIVGWTQTGCGGTHARQLNNVANRRATVAMEKYERDQRDTLAKIRLAAQERLIAELDTAHSFEEREMASHRRQIDETSSRQTVERVVSDDVSEVSTIREDQGVVSPRPELRHADTAPAPTSVNSLVEAAIDVLEREHREARSALASTTSPPQQLPRMMQRRITIAEPDQVLPGRSAAEQAPLGPPITAAPPMTEAEAFRQENKSWNFMLAQMNDWTEREKSWAKFRETLENKRGGLLARRLGLKGRRSLSRG